MEVYIYEGSVGVVDLGFITVGCIRVSNQYVGSFNPTIKEEVLCD